MHPGKRYCSKNPHLKSFRSAMWLWWYGQPVAKPAAYCNYARHNNNGIPAVVASRKANVLWHILMCSLWIHTPQNQCWRLSFSEGVGESRRDNCCLLFLWFLIAWNAFRTYCNTAAAPPNSSKPYLSLSVNFSGIPWNKRTLGYAFGGRSPRTQRLRGLSILIP